jgi:hypothetical protein
LTGALTVNTGGIAAGSCENTFTDAVTANSPDLFAVSGYNLDVASGALSSANDGAHSVTVQACENNACISQAISVTVNPPSSGIACDIGPSYSGTIPAAASNAGFTHCAANYDFTSMASFPYNSHVYNFDDQTTWLGGNGCSATNWLWFNKGYNSPATPCSDFTIVSDGGLNALQINYTQADLNNHSIAAWMQTTDNSGTAFQFPNGEYIEYVWRLNANSWYPNNPFVNSPIGNHDYWSLFTWSLQTPNHVEFDAAEWYQYNPVNLGGTGWGSCWHNWGNGGASGCAASQTVTSSPAADGANYHTYAMRGTSDGTNFGQCAYFDNSVLGCSGPNAYVGAGDATASQYWATGIGQLNDGTNFSYSLVNTVTGYWRRITIFTCPSWSPTNQTVQCNGTVNP